jgi:hypothetical protein
MGLSYGAAQPFRHTLSIIWHNFSTLFIQFSLSMAEEIREMVVPEYKSPGYESHLASFDPNQRRLHEIYEAYQAFYDNGLSRVAWRNLGLSLTIYLARYFHCDSGRLPIPKTSTRTLYLCRRSLAQIWDLMDNIVYVLLQKNGLLPRKQVVTPGQAITRKRLSFLPEIDLHELLIEMTNGFNERSISSYTGSGSGLETRRIAGRSFDFEVEDDCLPIIPISYGGTFTGYEDTSRSDQRNFFARRFFRRPLSIRLGTGVGVEEKPNSSPHFINAEVREMIDATGADPNTPRPYHNAMPITERPDSAVWRIALETSTNNSYHYLPELAAPFSKLRNSIKEQTPLVTGRISKTKLTKRPHNKLHAIEEETANVSHVDARHPLSSTFTELLSPEAKFDWPEIPENGYIQSHSPVERPETPAIFVPETSLVDTIIRWTRRSSVVMVDSSESQTYSKFISSLSGSSSFYALSNISARSGFSSYGASFVTAKSQPSSSDDARVSTSTRYSLESFVSAEHITSLEPAPAICGPYYDLLRERDLIPDPMIETDWSGRGQHAEYGVQEREHIPLQVEDILGETRNAIVQSVRCKRVRLVRKIMRCTKGTGLKREDAVREVEHLYRVQHSHVVRLVGTYAIGIDLAILTYPCAEWNLKAFMRNSYTAEDSQTRSKSLRQFFTCLANLFDFIHSMPIKHMDVKPQNLLVRDIRNSQLNGSEPYKIYLTDFGISRAYASVEECETETFTSFTRAYAAREVVLQESRGLSADIFSLGCVYTEMLAVILDISIATEGDSHTHWNSLLLARGKNGANFRPYHAAVEDTKIWLSTLQMEEPELCSVRAWTIQMLDTNSDVRPSARQVACDPQIPFPCLSCTLRSGPEDFEAAK